MSRCLMLLLLLLPALALGAEPVPGFGGIGQLGKVASVLLLMVLLIIGLATVLKRVNGTTGRMSGAIKVLSVTPIGTRERLMLVQVGDRQLLLGATSGRVDTLLVLDEPLKVPPAPARQPGGFAERLRDAIGAQRGESR